MKIPELSDAQLDALFDKIKPIVRDEIGAARLIKRVDLWRIAYTWDPEFEGNPVNGLHAIGEFRCLHSYGYYSLFKPSIAEVLCQIPSHLASRATHFEIVACPETAKDLGKELEALNAGFHVSTVRVYGAA